MGRLPRNLAAVSAAMLAGIALADPLSDAGLTADEIKSRLVDTVTAGTPSIPFGLRKLAPEARAELVRAAGDIAIPYFKSDDFKSRYADWRDEHAPKLEQISGDDMKTRNEQAKTDYDKSMSEQKEMVTKLEAQRDTYMKAGLTDAQIDQMLDQVRQAQKQLADMQASGQIPAGPRLMTEEQRQQENAERQKAYESAKAKFDEEHPVDPTQPVKRKLEEFLALSTTVDFDAKVESGRFADPANEGKSDQWKRCYRAGKPAVDAARTLAETWLKAL